MTARQLAVLIFAADAARGVRLSPLERLAVAAKKRSSAILTCSHCFVCLGVKP